MSINKEHAKHLCLSLALRIL